ncbi:hypothetical protein B4U79_12142, partial [Dinothrombium tinctorium]
FRTYGSFLRQVLNTNNNYSNRRDVIACKTPQLDPFSSQIIRFVKRLKPIRCSSEDDWVVVSNGKAILKRNDSNVQCMITYLIRVDDNTSRRGQSVLLSSAKPELTLEEDFFLVKCSDESSRQWKNIMASVHRDEKAVKRAKKILKEHVLGANKQKLNVFMFGFDSVSRAHFIRQMPQTYKHLVKQLNATVLQSYNIVGDGTPQALIPILTGSTEVELPLTRKRFPNAQFVNVYPFIWNDYTNQGYVTSYVEDGPNFGTFSYRLRGFDAKPTDHFGRPFYIEAQKQYKRHKPYCLGSQPRVRIMLDWSRQLFDVYPDIPKFAFGFHSEYSHDDFNLLQQADIETKQWLERLQNDGILENTILIVMSDHGNRFSTIRETQQGKQEERLPFFSFVLPKWFEAKFPNAVRNLRINGKDRLTTPFDLYATFLTILNLFNNGQDVSSQSSFANARRLPRSISLFEEIPMSRTCEDADIEAHWCTCLNWQPADVSNPIVKAAAQALVDFINGLTQEVRNLCALLEISHITRAEKAEPRKELLSFKQSKDYDGFVPDLSAHTSVSETVYQIQIITKPSQGVYEGTVQYNHILKSFNITESQISRVNMYGNQPHCILQTHQGLRKYCYCSVQLKSSDAA